MQDGLHFIKGQTRNKIHFKLAFGARIGSYAPWHFLYFLPLPQGQGSLRPTFSSVRWMGCFGAEAASPLFRLIC